MHRRLTLLLATLALTLAVAAPVAADATPAGAPTVVTEPIQDHNIHYEPDGTVIESRQTGTRTTRTFPDGRVMMSEAYTLHQVSTAPDGAMNYDSVADTSLRVIADGERTILFSLSSESQTTLGDGRTCESSSSFLVVNDKVVRQDEVGPICSE